MHILHQRCVGCEEQRRMGGREANASASMIRDEKLFRVNVLDLVALERKRLVRAEREIRVGDPDS